MRQSLHLISKNNLISFYFNRVIRKDDSHFTDFISLSAYKDIKIRNKTSMWNTDLGISSYAPYLNFVLAIILHVLQCFTAELSEIYTSH